LPENLEKDRSWYNINYVCEKQGYNLKNYELKTISKWIFDSVENTYHGDPTKISPSILLYDDEIICVYIAYSPSPSGDPGVEMASILLECRELTDDERLNSCYYDQAYVDPPSRFYTRGGALLCEIFVGKYNWKCFSYFKKGDEIFCEKLNESEDKQQCLWYIATETGNVNLCEKIVTESKKQGCYLGVAKMTGNVTLCEKLESSDSKDSCYRDIAEDTLNITLCYNIKKDYLKDSCIYVLSHK